MSEMPQWMTYDPQSEVITIDGIRYAREVFHSLAKWSIGRTYKLISREDGVITVQHISEASA